MEQMQTFDMPPLQADRDAEVETKSRAERAAEARESRSAQVRRAQRLIAERVFAKEHWQNKALCSAAGVDPAIFENPQSSGDMALAGAFCGACEVTSECAALGKTVPGGKSLVWGGKLGARNLIPPK